MSKNLILNKEILFFNQGDSVCYEFIPRPDRPNFFWYFDRFYCHLGNKHQDKYFHLFIRNPYQENMDIYAMQGIETVEDLDKHHLDIKKGISHDDPPILRIATALIPDLIFEFDTEGADWATVIFPDQHKGVRCRFFDDTHVPIPFTQIPELVEILPQILNCSF